jgi:hypothetical protein
MACRPKGPIHNPPEFRTIVRLDQNIVDSPPQHFRPEALVGIAGTNYDARIDATSHDAAQDVTPVSVPQAHLGNNDIDVTIGVQTVADLAATLDGRDCQVERGEIAHQRTSKASRRED